VNKGKEAMGSLANKRWKGGVERLRCRFVIKDNVIRNFFKRNLLPIDDTRHTSWRAAKPYNE